MFLRLAWFKFANCLASNQIMRPSIFLDFQSVSYRLHLFACIWLDNRFPHRHVQNHSLPGSSLIIPAKGIVSDLLCFAKAASWRLGDCGGGY
jgi:hypothetical protein